MRKSLRLPLGIVGLSALGGAFASAACGGDGFAGSGGPPGDGGSDVLEIVYTDGSPKDRTAPEDARVSDAGPDADGATPVAEDAEASAKDTVKQISAGGDSACAVTTAGALYCWGTNQYGSVGDGTTTSRTKAVLIAKDVTGAALPRVAQVSGGGRHMCAMMVDGSVYCWGNDNFGELGDGVDLLADAAVGWSTEHAPKKIPNLTATLIASGALHTCSETEAGVSCWGTNFYGELCHVPGQDGDQDLNPQYANSTPAAGCVIDGVNQIALSVFFGCANSVTESVLCWGSNTSGQLGDPDAGASFSPTAVPVPVSFSPGNYLGAIKQIAVGDIHACALNPSGLLYCWGSEGAGQMGPDVAVTQTTTPYAIQVASGAAFIASAGFTNCIIDASRKVQCWGANGYGVLGHDPATDPISSCPDSHSPCNPVPAVVLGPGGNALGEAVSLSIGGGVDEGWFACALRTDASVWCWGANDSGELGAGPEVGDAGFSFVPQQVTGLP